MSPRQRLGGPRLRRQRVEWRWLCARAIEELLGLWGEEIGGNAGGTDGCMCAGGWKLLESGSTSNVR